ncbi:MAG: SRPBCC domain-containing protein [Rhodococcus sp.]|nr:SRPBCC domain-containing protein [Rhodococcus sp. (in: high G+C Gram-positive bacteria)]
MSGHIFDGIEIERDIAAAPDIVFAAWTTPQHFARWFGSAIVEVPAASLDFNAEAGRAWKAQMVLPDGSTIDWAGDFVEVEPGKRLVFTITDAPADADRARIVVVLTPIPTGTRMHFTQETPGFSPEQKDAALAGWQGFIDELELIAHEQAG